MGYVLFRVPATEATRRAYADKVDTWARETLGMPQLASDVWAVQYRRKADGVLFAAREDARITDRAVSHLEALAAGTQLSAMYLDALDPAVWEKAPVGGA